MGNGNSTIDVFGQIDKASIVCCDQQGKNEKVVDMEFWQCYKSVWGFSLGKSNNKCFGTMDIKEDILVQVQIGNTKKS